MDWVEKGLVTMDNRTGVLWWGAFLSLLVVMMITVSYGQDDRETELLKETRAAILGKPMPKLSLMDWENGEVDLSELKDRFVVIEFWATWCPDCIAAIRGNNEFYERYNEWGVEFIGVCSSDRGQDRMRDMVAEWSIKYPVAKDPTLESMKAWAVEWWPTYALVDPDGIVRAVEGDIQSIESMLNRIGRFAE